MDLHPYDHKFKVVTERMSLWLQVEEESFLQRVAGFGFRDTMRSSVIWESLRVEPLFLQIERGQVRWLGQLTRIHPGHSN